MTVYRFTATPLTPIHIGTGDTLAPEDYLLRDDQLIRFNRSAVVRDMSTQVRHELESALDRNQFDRAQEIIRGACNPARHSLGRIGISDQSRDALQTLVAHPDSPVRSREVHPFVRNAHTGCPYIPGSSLKGAIRTALVNHFTQQHRTGIGQAVARADVRRRAQTLETEALNFEFRHLESDPMRLFKVADAALPDGCTRIDRALQYQRGKGFAEIQMHFERLLSRADGETISFEVELELDDRALADPRVQTLIGRQFAFDDLRKACNTFYTGRLLAEHQRFFADDALPELRYGAQGLVKLQPGKILIARSLRESGMLLRIGRFSHFESLSVDGLREGWNIQKKQPIQEGSTRTLCHSARLGESVPLSFGWLLLQPAEAA